MPKKTKKITVKGLSCSQKRNAKREIVRDKKGQPILLWKYRFTDRDGVRQTIYLGEGVQYEDAVFYAENLRRLVQCSKTPGAVLPQEIQTFIDGVDYSFRKKLLELELIDETERDAYESAATIGVLTDAYLEFHKNDPRSTYAGLEGAARKLVEFFRKERKIIDITSTDVRHYQDSLYQKHAEATASRLCGRAKEICRFGVREDLITREVFEKTFKALKIGKMYNLEREQYVTVDMYNQIVSACINTELRFMIYLARFLALRCPSECKSWRWSMIDFEAKRVNVLDVKRKEFRKLPMFYYVYPFLAELLHYHGCKSFVADLQKRRLPLQWASLEIEHLLQERGRVYVAEMVARFPKNEDWIFSEAFRNRESRGKQIEQLLHKAKVRLEKPFVNMRGTCESEWVQEYGIKAACMWTGNSVKVAAEHYLRILPETWLAATGDTTESIDVEKIRKLLRRYTVEGLKALIDKAAAKTSGESAELEWPLIR